MSAEKENVFRALREEELFVTFWGCRFGWHKWTKYRDPEHIKEGYYDIVQQSRCCSSCNINNRLIIRKW